MFSKIIFFCFLIASVLGNLKENEILETTTSSTCCPYRHMHNGNHNKIIVPLHHEKIQKDKYGDSDPNPLIIPAINSTNSVGYLTPDEIDAADNCFPETDCTSNDRFRTFDGSCNNLKRPSWGQALRANIRIIQADYSDGVSALRKTVSGNPLPNARHIRTKIFPNADLLMKDRNLYMMQFGQLISHDTTKMMFTFENETFHDLAKQPQCCGPNDTVLEKSPKRCISITIPRDDPDFKKECLSVVRAINTKDLTNCSLTPTRQIIELTSFIDGSVIYGSNKKTAKSLRSFRNGKLGTQKGPDGKDFFTNVNNPTKTCQNADNNTVCYVSGDDRVTQHPGIAVAMISLLRLHNNICDQLLALNPHWNDEQTYQEARRLVGAIFQHISYNEYVPAFLGKDFAKANKLLPSKEGFINGYDENLNPTTMTSFQSAAFRVGHTHIAGDTQRVDDTWKTKQVVKLSDTFNNVSRVQDEGEYDNIMRGMLKQKAHRSDRYFQNEITNLLFVQPNATEGSDLISTDIQRGRDFGVPSYNKFRQLCGLPKASTFDDLKDEISQEHVKLLQEVYENVEDIDFYVAGLLETNRPGAVVGPTFQCIIGEMFYRWKYGDRFYYEFKDQLGSFTTNQLEEIHKTSLAQIICETSDITLVQKNALYPIDDEMNPLVPCTSIMKLNLSAWKEESEDVKTTSHSFLSNFISFF